MKSINTVELHTRSSSVQMSIETEAAVYIFYLVNENVNFKICLIKKWYLLYSSILLVNLHGKALQSATKPDLSYISGIENLGLLPMPALYIRNLGTKLVLPKFSFLDKASFETCILKCSKGYVRKSWSAY